MGPDPPQLIAKRSDTTASNGPRLWSASTGFKANNLLFITTDNTLYRAVGKAGDTVDFMLTAKRDMAAAKRYLERAFILHGFPEKITIDKSGANTAAVKSINADACLDIELRQSIYLNIIVEQITAP